MALTTEEKKIFRKLKNRKFRDKLNVFVAEGEKICDEIRRVRPDLIQQVYVTENKKQLKNIFQSFRVKVLAEDEFNSVVQTVHSQGILVLCKKENFSLPEKTEAGFSFYLSGLQDPGNVGTILRICAWFGIKDIFCSPDTVPWYHPKVIQASMGAFLYTRMHEVSQEWLLRQNIFQQVIRADISGSPPRKSGHSVLILLGNEGSGFPEEIRKRFPQAVSIPPGYSGSGPESLNVAVTCGILAYVFSS
jgi:TrmH family RNA methyltransferase